MRQELIESTQILIENEHDIRVGTTIDLFYDIYHKRTEELKYFEKGATEFQFTLFSVEKMALPLEIMFKNIHATREIPLIKYNPGFRRENIYRIYTEDITKYGEKVPYLEKNIILRIARQMGRKKTISFFIEGKTVEYKGIFDFDVFMELNMNGQIRIHGQIKKPIEIELLNEQIALKTNSIIDKINSILLKSGHELSPFTNLNDMTRVRIDMLKYNWSMKIKNEISLKKMGKCLYPIFEFYGQDKEQNALEEGVQSRFKRVENYQTMETEDIFISELYSKTEDINHVLESFKESFPDKSEEYAREKISTFFNHLRELKIKDSPGFPVKMNIQTFNDMTFTFQAEISDNIEYLHVLDIYVDSLLRITQSTNTTRVPLDQIKQICLKTPKITRDEKHAEKEAEKIASTFSGIRAVEAVPILIQPIEFIDESNFFDELEPASIPFEIEDEPEPENEEELEIEFEDDEEYEGGTRKKTKNPFESEETEEIKLDENELDVLPDNTIYENMGYNFKETSEENAVQLEQHNLHLDGMSLRDGMDNIFLSRLKERDPVLFLNEDVTTSKGKFNAYAKNCQANAGRQPVILTEEEKNEIDKKHPGSYKNALQYGIKDKNKFWYICPRYWCLLTNSSITEEEMKSGVCGKIIPKNAKKIPKGHYVLENKNDNLHMNPDGNYTEATPGFLKGNLHPDGYCLPCCFKKEWDAPQQKKRRESCIKDTEKVDDDATATSHAPAPAQSQAPAQTHTLGVGSNYIVGMDKYPVGKGRWGFLPINVQHLFQIDQSKVVDKNNSGTMKHGFTTLLRAGIEDSTNQTFVSCLADIYSNKRGIPLLNVSDMCKILADAVDLDVFLKLQNGTLPVSFQPKTYNIEAIDFRKYESTRFLKSLPVGKVENEEFVADTIAAFENFQDFLLNPESLLNHEYLWDLVCIPNLKLFQRGLNLAILHIVENDITDNIEILCPTSAYSNQIYDTNKETLILILRENKFEPVYMYENRKNQPPVITRTFKDKDGPTSLQYILQIIRNTSKKYCAPLPSMPKIYKFKRNKPASEILQELTKYTHVNSQVLNYQGKVIGISTDLVYVPVSPSILFDDANLKIQYMDDANLWKSYEESRDALIQISEKSAGKILCKPTHKIIEEDLIVGILTETNQFIMIDPPEVNSELDELIEIRETNYILADKAISSNEVDTEREMVSRKIRLETHFYKIFRSTFRLVLHQPEHAEYKKKLMKYLDAEYEHLSIYTKIKRVEKILQKILHKYVDFHVYQESILMSLDEITNCFGKEEDVVNLPYCLLQTNTRKLILPKYHLISRQNNKTVYFLKLADEFLRNKRIQTYLLNSKLFDIGFSNEYSVYETELILLQSIMNSEYFDTIGEPLFKINRGKISYEKTMPYQSTPYINRIPLDEQSNMFTEINDDDDDDAFRDTELESECLYEINEIIGNQLNVWKKTFPKTAREMFLNNKPTCTFYPLILIYREVYGKIITIDLLKKTLWNFYKKIDDLTPLLKLWKYQGKRDVSNQIRDGKLTLEDAIMNSGFYLCNIDIWAICDELQLPVILFTSMKKMKHLSNDVSWIRLGKNEMTGKYWFIRAPTEPDGTSNMVLNYSIITQGFTLEEIGKFKDKYETALQLNDNHVIEFIDYLEKPIII